jgi:ribosomal protein S8
MNLVRNCDVCDITIQAGRSMDEHDAGQIHKALKDALSHMTGEEFLQFWERLKSKKKRKILINCKRAAKTDTVLEEIQQVQPNMDTIPDDILQVQPNIKRVKVSP